MPPDFPITTGWIKKPRRVQYRHAVRTGSNSDALLALNPDEEWAPCACHPLGFYSRGMDGRIDDPNGGWKGRGLWSNYGTHFVWHIEGGKGAKGKIVHFQVRPDPLAR
jgi:hypothetical protein